MNLKTSLIIACLVALGVYNWWSQRSIKHGPGVMAPHAPKQQNIRSGQPFPYKEFQITPLAHFEIEAKVLSVEHYSWGREAALSPIDLALGWGPMSDEAVLDKITIRQSNRFYYWSTRKFPIPRKEIERNSANMHLIPANSAIASRIKKTKKGQVVFFKGFLIKVEAKNGWHWTSSMTRNDNGKGACELIWVEEFN